MDKKFNVLGISSGRTMGNAEVMLREALMTMEGLGDVDVRITRLRTLKLKENRGDFSAMDELANGGDGLIDGSDDFEWIKEQILWADAIIFSVPCFTYQPTAEVVILMNRALGLNKDYVKACRENPKLVGLIAVGGSDTIDFHLPVQGYAMEKVCPGYELVDQFYADWIRGKGFISKQPWLLERAQLMGKRLVNRLNGYKVPPIKTRIEKLNPAEHKDDIFVDLEECPICHSAVMEADNVPAAYGQFRCSICGTKGHVEYHGGKHTYAWDDDTVAHNRFTPEHDDLYVDAYRNAHAPVDLPKEFVPEFPILTPAADMAADKPYILAIVAGPKGGTSELLARRALMTATADGAHQGVIINVLDLKIHFCTGCLLCKINARYRGGKDICVLKDDFLWMVDKLIHSVGVIVSMDVINGYTYGTFLSAVERFGHFDITKVPGPAMRPKPFLQIASSFDDQAKAVTFAMRHFTNFFCGMKPPFVGEELLTNVPLVGDKILTDRAAMGKIAFLGKQLGDAIALVDQNPAFAGLVREKNGVCPCCKLDLIELRPDMTVACPLCDSEGKYTHVFGEDDIIWEPYSVSHSRFTFPGAMLHFKHIDFSQSDDRDALDNPKVIAEDLAKYQNYGKLVRPTRK